MNNDSSRVVSHHTQNRHTHRDYKRRIHPILNIQILSYSHTSTMSSTPTSTSTSTTNTNTVSASQPLSQTVKASHLTITKSSTPCTPPVKRGRGRPRIHERDENGKPIIAKNSDGTRVKEKQKYVQVTRGRGKSPAAASIVTNKTRKRNTDVKENAEQSLHVEQGKREKRKREDGSARESKCSETKRQKRNMKRVVNLLEKIVEEDQDIVGKKRRAPRRGKVSVQCDSPSSSSSNTPGEKTYLKNQNLFTSYINDPAHSTSTSQQPKTACAAETADSSTPAPELDKGKQKATSPPPASPPPPTPHWLYVLESETKGRDGFARLRERCEAYYRPPVAEEEEDVSAAAAAAQPRAFSPIFQEHNLGVMPVAAFGPCGARETPSEEDMRRWGACG